MKPILPKSGVGRGSQPHGLVAGPRTTTIILAPTLGLATPQPASLLLPSCEVVAPTPCLPQPSPLMLPLTPTIQGQPPTFHLHLAPHLPPSSPNKLEVKHRKIRTKSKSCGELLTPAQSSAQPLPGCGVRADKGVKAILPKAAPAEAQTVIVLPAAPSYKPVVTRLVPVSVQHSDSSTMTLSKMAHGNRKKKIHASRRKSLCQNNKELSIKAGQPVDTSHSGHKNTKEKTLKNKKHSSENPQTKKTAELADRSLRQGVESHGQTVEVDSGGPAHTPHSLPPFSHQSTILPAAHTPGESSSLQSGPGLHKETQKMKSADHQQLFKKCGVERQDSGDVYASLSCDTKNYLHRRKCSDSSSTPLDTISKSVSVGSSLHAGPAHSPSMDTNHTLLSPLKLPSHAEQIQSLRLEQKTPVDIFSSSNISEVGSHSPASAQVPVSPCLTVSSSVPSSHCLSSGNCTVAATTSTQPSLFSSACSYNTDGVTHSSKQLQSYPASSQHSRLFICNSETPPCSSQSAPYSSSSFAAHSHLAPADASSSCARDPHSSTLLNPPPLPSPDNTVLSQPLSSCQSPPPYAQQQSPHYSCSHPDSSPFSHSSQTNSFLPADKHCSVATEKASSYIYSPQQAHLQFPQSTYMPFLPASDAQSTKIMLYTQSPQQMPYVESPQPVAYEPAPDPYAHSPHTSIDAQYHHLGSYSQSPHSTPHTTSQGLKFSSQLDPQITYHQSPHNATCSLPLSHIVSDNESHSPQALALPQGYKDSYEPSQSDSCLSFNPDALENPHLSGVLRNMTKSPTSQTMPSTSQCIPSAPHLLSSMHQPDVGHDTLLYTAQKKNQPFTSYSGDTNFSSSSLQRSLSPPSYEAHLQSTALYQSSEHSPEKLQYCQADQQKTPANYSLAYHNPEPNADTSAVHCKDKESCPPAYPLHFCAPPPPQYTPKRQMRYTDPAAVSSVSKECPYKDGAPHIFYPDTPPLAPPPPAPPPLHSLEAEVHAYHSEPGAAYSHEAAPYLSSHSQHRQDHERLLYADADSSRTKAGGEVMHRQHSHQADVAADWKPCTDNMKVHNLIENAKRLWFIPHQEQNRVYLRRKELARNILCHSESYAKRDLMLKETFWIEEDEPISDEILSSVLRKEAGEDVPLEGGVEEGAEKEQQQQQQESGAEVGGASARQLLCQVCGKLVKGRRCLRTHLQSHQGIQPHACPSCPKRFTHRSVLVEHLRIHTGAMPYSCSQCNTSFRTRSALRRHGSLHTNLRPYQCSTCSKSFKTKLVLQQHLKLHLGGGTEGGGPRGRASKTLGARPHRYKCPHCQKGYHFLSLLNHHMQVHLGISKHVCEVCGRKFVWRSGLVAHMNTHSTSRPKCDVCGAHFASEKRLESHYNKRHTNPPCHRCEVCGRSFAQAYRLAYHSLLHKKDRDYSCKKCDVTLTSVKKFRKHIASHRKERPPTCRGSGGVEVADSSS